MKRPRGRKPGGQHKMNDARQISRRSPPRQESSPQAVPHQTSKDAADRTGGLPVHRLAYCKESQVPYAEGKGIVIAIRLVLRVVDLALIIPLRIAAAIVWNLVAMRAWIKRRRFILGANVDHERSNHAGQC